MRRVSILLLITALMCQPSPAAAEPPADRVKDLPADIVVGPVELSFRKGTVLGVSATPLPESLRAQVDLPEPFGLLVGHIVPDSPAAKAGLAVHDVLYKLDDHVLVNAEQLAAIVGARKPGDMVRLTVYRKGKPQMVETTLAEGEVRSGFEANIEPLRAWIRAEVPQVNLKLDNRARWGDFIKFHERNAGEAPSPDTVNVSMSDGEHSLALTADSSGRRLVAKDGSGKVIFDGPINTREQMERVPAELRGKLKKMQATVQTEQPVNLPGLSWYYDVETKEYFTDSPARVAPFKRDNGHEAVRAHFFSCGDCDQGERFIGYYEKYTDEVKQKIESRADTSKLYEAAFSGRLYSKDGQTWLAADKPEGIAITTELQKRCPPKTLRYCPPTGPEDRIAPNR